GARDSTVISATSCTTRSDRPAPVPRSILMADWAKAATGHATQARVASSDNRAARFRSAFVGIPKMAARLEEVMAALPLQVVAVGVNRCDRTARLDQFAALAQQDQAFFLIDADQNQTARGIENQGFDDLQ